MSPGIGQGMSSRNRFRRKRHVQKVVCWRGRLGCGVAGGKTASTGRQSFKSQHGFLVQGTKMHVIQNGTAVHAAAKGISARLDLISCSTPVSLHSLLAGSVQARTSTFSFAGSQVGKYFLTSSKLF